MTNRDTCDISIVIPVHNEEAIIEAAVHDLLAKLPEFGRKFEIILAENGSSDETVALARKLSERHAEVSTFSAPSAFAAIAATGAESIPPLSPMIAFEWDVFLK